MQAATTQTHPGLEKLERQRQETMTKMENLRIDLRNMAEPSADEADIDAYEREKTWALYQTMQHKLTSIDRAIELAQEGTYGICQSCGGRIEPARLEILPEAALCLDCQRAYERSNKRRRR
jgi:RNA polymerase-binding protein DksA